MNTIHGYRCDADSGRIYGKRLKRAIGRINGRGYVEISSAGMVGLAHRMIWESVHGLIPAGMQINHINGIKTDNRLVNLELVTPHENLMHAYQVGLKSALGERNGRSILTINDVIEIRSSLLSSRSLARKYGVGCSTIRDVRNGKNWSHVA